MEKNQVLNAYRKMFLLRRMEEDLVKYYFDNKVMSFVHFYIGQEAVAVGVCENLLPEDNAFGNHRSHGHYLAKGGSPEKMVSELLGKITGCCRGKGGSMHMIDRSVNFVGSTPILGSVGPISAGSALTQKLTGSKNITVSFIGDGASEEGVSYETINFAALFKLPLLLVIENNLYSVQSRLKDRRGERHDTERIVEGIGVRYFRADGNDFFDVYEKAKEAIRNIKENGEPSVLECVVYRHMAHSAPICDDKAGYREQDDNPENRVKHDSVLKLRSELITTYEVPEKDIMRLEDEVNIVSSNAIQFAVQSDYPEQSELIKDVYHE
jgi:TPP-dependent pyruvate/acetoin dehydrogenase alpha subunit